MAGVKIRLNHDGIDAFLNGPEVRVPLRDLAEQRASRARASAPVATGKYRDSISVESDTTDRAVERVVAHDRKSVLVESRTGNLKRALR